MHHRRHSLGDVSDQRSYVMGHTGVDNTFVCWEERHFFGMVMGSRHSLPI